MYQSLERDSSESNINESRRSDDNPIKYRRALMIVAILMVVGLVLFAGMPTKRNSQSHLTHEKMEGIKKPVSIVEDVYGGRIANEKEFPFVVDESVCTGSLLSPNWVLTARHCGPVKAGHTIYAGSNTQGQGVSRTIQSHVDNPDYDADMRLVYVANPFPINDVITVVPFLYGTSSEAPPDGTMATTIGYGANEENTDKLKAAAVRVERKDATWKRFMACETTCPETLGQVSPGDSGGPLVIGEGAGIVQWGVNRANGANKLSIWGDVSYFYGWIESTMRTKPVSLPMSVPVGATSAGKYYIENKKSGKRIDVPANSHSSGVQLIQYTPKTVNNQKFELVPVDQIGGYYLVKCVSSGLYWDIHGNWVSNNGKLIQYGLKPLAERANQMFKFEQLPGFGGYYRITAKHAGKVIEVEANSISNDAKMITYSWKSSGNDNQLFKLVRV